MKGIEEATIVVCKTKPQAKNLFKRTIQRYRDIRLNVRVMEDKMRIHTPYETFWFVSERSLCNVLCDRKYIKCNLASGYVFDKWLDKKEDK